MKQCSTGGTYDLLAKENITVSQVSEVTGFPEILDGRVKTLHPAIHGGVLARRDIKTHMESLNNLNINAIDIVVVNLYPFEATLKKTDVTNEEILENILKHLKTAKVCQCSICKHLQTFAKCYGNVTKSDKLTNTLIKRR